MLLLQRTLENSLAPLWECCFVKLVWNEIGNRMKSSSWFPNGEFSFVFCIGSVNDTTNLLFLSCNFSREVSLPFLQTKFLSPSRKFFFRTILNCLDHERRYAVKLRLWENLMQNGEPLSGKIIFSLSQNFDSIKFVVFCCLSRYTENSNHAIF